MIQQLCPNGVEFSEMKDVCEFKRGSTITAKDVIEGDIPVIAGGQKPAYFHNKANRFGETISVSSSGAYAGFVSYWTIPVFLSDSFSVEPNEQLLNKKYVFHFLKNIQEKIYATKKGGGVPHVHGSNLAKFKIPVPPLDIQREIVIILDKFTELEVELEVELEARKKQYEFYRDKLLNFKDLPPPESNVVWKTLGEIATIAKGKQLNRSELFESGEYPVLNGGISPSGYYDEFNTNENTIAISQGGASAGYVNFVKEKFWAGAHCYIISPNSNLVLNKFLYYCLKNGQSILQSLEQESQD